MKFFSFALAVVEQSYGSKPSEEYVLTANSALMKCTVPSFVADFIHVQSWVEEASGTEYYHSKDYGARLLFYAI